MPKVYPGKMSIPQARRTSRTNLVADVSHHRGDSSGNDSRQLAKRFSAQWGMRAGGIGLSNMPVPTC